MERRRRDDLASLARAGGATPSATTISLRGATPSATVAWWRRHSIRLVTRGARFSSLLRQEHATPLTRSVRYGNGSGLVQLDQLFLTWRPERPHSRTPDPPSTCCRAGACIVLDGHDVEDAPSCKNWGTACPRCESQLVRHLSGNTKFGSTCGGGRRPPALPDLIQSPLDNNERSLYWEYSHIIC